MTIPSEVAARPLAPVPPAAEGRHNNVTTIESPATVTERIIAAADALRAHDPRALPVACWDLDGTLLEGDCVDGYCRPDGAGYMGLVERAIRGGLCPAYAEADGATRCDREFRDILRREGRATAYAFQSQIFAGAAEPPLQSLATDAFAIEMADWLFVEARACWHQLEAHGIECWIVSASPEFFVQAAAAWLGVPSSRGLGMRLERGADGRLGERLDGPVMFGEGKTVRLHSMLSGHLASDPSRVRYPIAAFGNDLESDGPMLAEVSQTRLPAGRPLAVYVNVAPADPSPDSVCVRFSPRPPSASG